MEFGMEIFLFYFMFLGVALYLGQLFYNLLCTIVYTVCGSFNSCCFVAAAAPLLGSWFNAAVAALLRLLLPLLLLLLILGRTIPCSAILPLPGLELGTAPLALAIVGHNFR